VFDSQLGQARERLAKQDARARTRSSSGAFAGECAEQLIESHKLSTAARRCGGGGVQGGFPLFCFSFAGVFFFKQKENAETWEVHIL